MQKEISLAELISGSALPVTRLGRGYSFAHHGEILQGVFEETGGSLRRGLITLVSNMFESEAIFYADSNNGVRIEPHWKGKARLAAELTLRVIGGQCKGGRLVMSSNIPPSWGFGSSTCDVTAATKAVADAFNMTLPCKVVAGLVVKAEIASDPIMFDDRAVLFGQRDGVILEDFSGTLPPLEVVGFNTDPEGVETLAFPPARYTWWEVEAFRPLLGLVRQAVFTQDAKMVGQVATASAQINQRHLPKPQFDKCLKLAERVEALGVQVAHSGTLVGLLFDPDDPALTDRVREAQMLLGELRGGPIWHFRSASEYLSIPSAEMIEKHAYHISPVRQDADTGFELGIDEPQICTEQISSDALALKVG
jgi:uncharacterized protein involved in propanediol utilization